MKLPILDMKRISRINCNKKNEIKINTHRTLSNFFLFPKNNISSIYSDNKLKKKQHAIQKEMRFKNKNLNFNNLIRTKIIQLDQINPEIFKVNGFNNNYLNLYNCKSSNRLNSNEMNSTEEHTFKNNNYETYIKNTFNTFRIKKEISSLIYSSTDKQNKFINFLSDKFNKNHKEIRSLSMNVNINNKNFKHKKIKQKKEKKIKLTKEQKDDSDEDKTNLKEFNLLSLIMGNRREKKNLKNNNKKQFLKTKLIECWDNNLLKKVLPKNVNSKRNLKLKSTESRNKYNDFSFQSKQEGSIFKSVILDPLKVNSVDGNLHNKYKYLYKYNFEKGKK